MSEDCVAEHPHTQSEKDQITAKAEDVVIVCSPKPSMISACCKVSMGYRDTATPCMRPLHDAPEGIDEQPVCLMHSRDPRKQTGLFFTAFMEEIERTLDFAGEGEAHFEQFVFPQIDFEWRVFQAFCLFTKATFMGRVNLRFADFTKEADFSGAVFLKEVDLLHATITRSAIFAEARFIGEANFKKAYFVGGAFFRGAKFDMNACFSGAIFSQSADFNDAEFSLDAMFRETTFDENAYFSGTLFARQADFISARFANYAEFSNATFAEVASFVKTEFRGTADWQGSRFNERAEFREIKFHPRFAGQPSALYSLARFSNPNEIVFDDIDLSRAIFYNRDVSQILFTSSVRWGSRSQRGLSIFEETIPLDHEIGKKLRRDGKRDFGAVAQIYRQLKQNYDSRSDYWTANEFHYGEMEMKRLAGPTKGVALGLRGWFWRTLSLVALYRYACDYGNNYRKLVLWLMGALVLFATLFPLPGAGLREQESKQCDTYASVWRTTNTARTNMCAEAKLTGKSIIASIDTALFQKTPEYLPSYPWGRLLAIVEVLITSTLFALFLLAIRRQFKR